MAIDMNIAIQNMERLERNKVWYSMNGSRDGSDGSGDCSGTVVSSIWKAGASKPSWLYNTDSMHAWLLANGFKLISASSSWDAKRGDVVIWGQKGASGGAAGHTFIFKDKNTIIDCAYQGENRNPAVKSRPEPSALYPRYFYVYRYGGGTPTPAPSAPIKPNETPQTGNLTWYKEKGTFTLTENIWLRTVPSIKGGKDLAYMPKGTRIKYDQFTYNDGYIWIRQPRSNGQYAYMATGEGRNGERKTYWGSFS